MRSTSTSRPTAAAASRPANRPCVTAASTERAPATAPAAWTFDGSSTGRYACAASSNASSAPVIASRFVDGIANPDDTTRSHGDLVARPGAGGPDGHARDASPAVRRQDGLPAEHVERRRSACRLVGAQVDDGDGRAGVPEEPGRAIPRLARRQHHRPPAREDAERLDQTLHRRREHDPRADRCSETPPPARRPRSRTRCAARGPGRGRGDSRPPRAARRTRRTPASRSGSARPASTAAASAPGSAPVSARCSSRSVSTLPPRPPRRPRRARPSRRRSRARRNGGSRTSRGAWSSSRGTMPRPAFERMNGSTMCHAQRGRWNIL